MAIINSTTDLKEFLSVNVNIDFKSIKPYIDNAQIEFLEPWLGDDIIEDFEDNISSTDDVYKKGVPMLQRALTYFSVLKGLPFMELNIGDEGVTRTESENYKSAYRGQVARIEEQLKSDAYNGLERFLNFLEKNKGDYPLWEDAPGYVEFSNYIFTDSKDFAFYYPIINGRLTYNRILASMRYVTEFFIKAEIGSDQYDDFFGKKLSNSISEEEIKAIGYLKNAIAHLTISQSLIDGWTTLTDQGVYFSERVEELSKQTSADPIQLAAKIGKIEERGRAYLAILVTYLNNNLSSFPIFQNDNSIIKINDDQSGCVGGVKGFFLA